MREGTYKHPYGGVAWDIAVKPERMAKFMGVSVEQIKQAEPEVKLFNTTVRDEGKDMELEVTCYVSVGPRGGRKYIMTYIDHEWKRAKHYL